MVLPLPQDDRTAHAPPGFRVIAPDLVGFGRSDKPDDRADYTYARHVEWMRAALFDELDLSDVTLVGQDWGGLIGLRLVAEHPDRFRRVVAANTGLPTGDTRHGRGLPGLAEVLPGGARHCRWDASWAADACPTSRPR